MTRSSSTTFAADASAASVLALSALLDLEHEIAAEALVHERRAGRDRRGEVGDRRQHLVVDGHRFRGVERGGAILRDHRRDHVADMAHAVVREGRPRRLVHRPPVAERHRVHDLQLAEAGLDPVVRR